MIGKAVRICDLSPRQWYPGSALYQVAPPVEVSDGGFLTETDYVIVTFSPATVDHGEPETALFAARSNGRLFRPRSEGGIEEGSVNCLSVYVRGQHGHRAALARLQGGYHVTESVAEVELLAEEWRGRVQDTIKEMTRVLWKKITSG